MKPLAVTTAAAPSTAASAGGSSPKTDGTSVVAVVEVALGVDGSSPPLVLRRTTADLTSPIASPRRSSRRFSALLVAGR